ncbi:DNA polymerase III subunit alpha [Ligilactobacillus sp. LYQ139]|uniref:DNA polymerase III subunit alpha n=1 Tax=Ligilactobacillus sp. LYQ139 TaxID=3378800 RepID=UPI00385281F7
MNGPLQVISCNSILQSTLRVKDYVAVAQKMGYTTLALTDRNVMYGTLSFYEACHQAGIKPVLGITLELNNPATTSSWNRLIVLAQDAAGYQNLLQLSSLKLGVNADQPANHAVTPEEIAPYLGHTFVVTDPLHSSLRLPSTDSEWLRPLVTAAGPDHVFVGISPQQDNAQNEQLITRGRRLGIAPAAVWTVEYLTAHDYGALQVARAIQRGITVDDGVALTHRTGGAALVSPEKLERQMNSLPAVARRNTRRIMETATVTVPFKHPELPAFPVPAGQVAADYLKAQCEAGLASLVPSAKRAPYIARLNHELAVIHRMGFDDYFLIVSDVVRFAHDHGIMVGPGRGSAAGSLVAYALGITTIDPLASGLLFERFLNEERQQMPDIDLDIIDSRREEVVRYVHQKYGEDRVAQIIALSTMGPRQVIQDVTRTLGLPQYRQAEWSRALPRGVTSLQEAYQQSGRLRDLVDADELGRACFKIARTLEGLPRQTTVHAAGVVLSAAPLTSVVPVQMGNNGILLSQYAKGDVERVGLLKMDFLGLRNLSVLQTTLRLVNRHKKVPLREADIPLNDPATLKMMAMGQTSGVFQFESAGIRRALRQVAPTTFDDIVAVNALYRPGPLANIDEFAARRHGRKPVTYPAPAVRPILAATSGIIIYQEQVMQVAATLAGFSMAQADLLRRAISKKDQQALDNLRTAFIRGAVARGTTQQAATQVFQYIERFGNYGFNKSHAVAYSKLAVQLAYLKCHYPAAFYVALLNSTMGNRAKMQQYVSELQYQHISVAPPLINRAGRLFTLHHGRVVFGLRMIRGLRSDVVDSVLTERKKNGPFTSFKNFVDRLDQRFRQVELITPLIYSGAFDEFGSNRAQLVAELPGTLTAENLSGTSAELKDVLASKIQPATKLTLVDQLTKEQEYLGVRVSGHPTDQYRLLGQIIGATPVARVTPAQHTVRLIVMVKAVRKITTKKGLPMAFVTCEDAGKSIELTVFSRVYLQNKGRLRPGQLVVVTGRPEERNGQVQVVVDQLLDVTAVDMKKCFLRLPASRATSREKLHQILMTARRGKMPVILVDDERHFRQLLPKKYWLDERMVPSELKMLLGSENVVIK